MIIGKNNGCLEAIRAALIGKRLTREQLAKLLPQYTDLQIKTAISRERSTGMSITCQREGKRGRPSVYMLASAVETDKPKRYHPSVAPPLTPRAYDLTYLMRMNTR